MASSKKRRFLTVIKEESSTQNPEKAIYNFCKYVLLDCQKSFLINGLNFSILVNS